jgi:hypothetical protein
MADIIPGVPTPRQGDPKCVLSTCARLIAQVDCILQIMQGTTGCIDIQLFDVDGLPLNLDYVSELRVMLFDEVECTVADFYYPSVPSGCTGFDIQFLQETDTAGNIINEGLIRICLDKACTSIGPGAIYAELLITLQEPVTGSTGSYTEETIGIPCIMVAQILPSKIFQNGCNGGCNPNTGGFVTGVY